LFGRFVVRGWVDDRPRTAQWEDGRLTAESDVRARAEVVVGLGERSTGPRPTAATLDGDPVAALFTVSRAFSVVESIEIDLRDPETHDVPDDELPGLAGCVGLLALLAAGRAASTSVVVPAPVELDAASSPAFSRELAAVPDSADVVIDMADLLFCGVSGLRVILDDQQWREAAGGTLRIRNPARSFLRLVDACGLVDRFVCEHPTDARRGAES
jgi:anti-anti-sigma factor